MVGTPVGAGDVSAVVVVMVSAPIGPFLGMTGVSLNVDGNDHRIDDLLAGSKGWACVELAWEAGQELRDESTPTLCSMSCE